MSRFLTKKEINKREDSKIERDRNIERQESIWRTIQPNYKENTQNNESERK